MSNTVKPQVQEFVDAQMALADRVGDLQAAFSLSAIKCHEALSTRGVTLTMLSDANKAAVAELPDFKMLTSVIYTSPTSITYHALTGQVLSLAYDEDHGDDVEPTEVQKLVIDGCKTVGTKRVKAIVRKAGSQQEFVEILAEEIKALKAAEKATEETGSEESGEESGEESAPVTEAQTVETLLSRALAMIGDGPVSDSARDLIAQLVGKTGPVAVPAVAVAA